MFDGDRLELIDLGAGTYEIGGRSAEDIHNGNKSSILCKTIQCIISAYMECRVNPAKVFGSLPASASRSIHPSICSMPWLASLFGICSFPEEPSERGHEFESRGHPESRLHASATATQPAAHDGAHQ